MAIILIGLLLTSLSAAMCENNKVENYTNPQDVGQLVKVGEGQDIDSVTISLASHLEDLSGYDTVWLVSPVWHYIMKNSGPKRSTAG